MTKIERDNEQEVWADSLVAGLTTHYEAKLTKQQAAHCVAENVDPGKYLKDITAEYINSRMDELSAESQREILVDYITRTTLESMKKQAVAALMKGLM